MALDTRTVKRWSSNGILRKKGEAELSNRLRSGKPAVGVNEDMTK